MSQESHTPPTRTGPITILDSDTAKLYTHIHPVLILALYTYKFRSIVADPVPALSQTLVGLSVLQIAFAAICLPPTSGDGSVDGGRGKSGEKSGGKVLGKKKRVGAAGKTEVEFWKAMPAFLSLLASIPLALPAIFIVMVLLGAPLTTHFSHTALAAAHISVLATMPLVYVYGINRDVCLEVVGLKGQIDEVMGAFVGTLVGGWLGVVPIPLDWDREWQKWPVTVVTGAYIGFVVGKLLGGTVLRGKKISFDA